MAALDHKPQITMDDGADLVTISTPSARRNWRT
jgi:S-adenosylhomocysteine hydrolase